MTAPGAGPQSRFFALVLLALLGAGVLWLRGPGLGFNTWNVDEAIHAAAARTLLDGGVLYRDAIDQRTPLTYHAVAAVFAVAGENNLRAVRIAVALLIAATGWLLWRATPRPRAADGLAAALAYPLLGSALLYAGDANAINTEWFVAAFSAAAAAVFLAGGPRPSPRRCAATGALLAGAFLSKQPALLDLAAPAAVLALLAARDADSRRGALVRAAALAGGWLAPVAATAAWFAAHDALGDAVYYTWTYNLAVYGAETTTSARLAAAALPFRLFGGPPSLLAVLLLGVAGLAALARRLAQRTPTAEEAASRPADAYVATWFLTSLAGAASSGRDFEHYAIPVLPAFCLALGRSTGGLLAAARTPGPAARRLGAALLLGAAAFQLGHAAWTARRRTQPLDPSVRVAAYIRAHSAPDDRLFVWGYHPDIYLHADRRPASRFLYASFLSGLVPWTNVAPGRDTAYAIVPGARETLLRELTARPPRFIVDCSPGPNRHWDKYPLETFPALRDFVAARYRPVEAAQFLPQGFALHELRPAGAAAEPAADALPAATAATLTLATLGPALAPVEAVAPHGAAFGVVDGRAELFAHAPSKLRYRLPAGAAALRGGFGLRAAAYAADNRAPTDGARFTVRWRGADGTERALLQRLLRPRDEAADRGVQSFRVELPRAAGELELEIDPGPAGNPASDWTFWTDLQLETSR